MDHLRRLKLVLESYGFSCIKEEDTLSQWMNKEPVPTPCTTIPAFSCIELTRTDDPLKFVLKVVDQGKSIDAFIFFSRAFNEGLNKVTMVRGQDLQAIINLAD